MSDEQADDTSTPFLDEKHFRDFLEGRSSTPVRWCFQTICGRQWPR